MTASAADGQILRVDFDVADDYNRWQGFLATRDDAHCTDLGQWRRLFRELYGITNYSYLFVTGGDVKGLVSVYRFRSPFMGDFLVTSPFFGYGGLIADNDEVRDALLAKVLAKAISLGVDYIELRLRERLPPPFAAAEHFLESQLNLLETPQQVWTEQVSSNVRQNIRRSRKSDLEFKMSTDPRACQQLLRRTLKAHGTPFHGKAMFGLLQRYFADETSFSEVWQRGELTAAGVVMRFGDSVITPYLGSLEQHRALRANYLQYWGIIEWCFEHGARRFELGRSPRGSTHIQFKRKWGAEDVAVRYNYLVIKPNKRYRNVATLSPIYRLATQTWRRLPLSVTSALGPYLARHVP